MLSKIISASISGIEVFLVDVEVDISSGWVPSWHMVGLPEAMVRESRERVLSAITNSGFQRPRNRKITINLAPADTKKTGTYLDLPIAIGILEAGGLCLNSSGLLIAGELSLEGRLLPVQGALPLAITAKRRGLRGIILPAENAPQAAIVDGLKVVGASNLVEVVRYLDEGVEPPPVRFKKGSRENANRADFSDVKGQYLVKRALEIAAAGKHNVLMIGPPGSGKTMLAERLPSILPPLTPHQAMETTKLYSLLDSGYNIDGLITTPPFRAPHHSASYAGLVGGGSGVPRLGEISLAHNGVLFLDELPEFRRDVLEVLRQPLESGRVYLSRAGVRVTYPAKFMLVAAMNPCRCGYLGHPTRPCVCSPNAIVTYRQKISGPLLDRIDLQVEVQPLGHHELFRDTPEETSSEVLARVLRAREIQSRRYDAECIDCNGELTPQLLRQYCRLDRQGMLLLKQAVKKLALSARAFDKILRIARTIADLTGDEAIKPHHIAEAIQYRTLDRFLF